MPNPPVRDSARTRRRLLWLVLFALLAVTALVLSIRFGSNPIPGHQVWAALAGGADSGVNTIIWDQRLPRTTLGALCGASLAVAGSLMQSLTRNPLAEPGLLGINAGASVAVVFSVILFGVIGIAGYMAAASIGAAITCIAVYLLGRGKSGSMVKLALAGVAISAALSSVNQALILANADAYNEFRFWAAGSLEARTFDTVLAVFPIMLLGLALAAWVCPAINALGAGEEAAIALGINLKRTQLLTLLAVTLLAGTTTAAIGPISFVGLAVPFIVRALLGNDVRWVTTGSFILGPAWLLGADVFARTIIAPEETHVGIIATLVGAPLFVALMARRKVVALS
ncbi:iron ABC transporter permease [Rothia nasimurium]|uniref:FecCD family ABC transporter permease n=1 Tax=Rothia nasimurium TaxID=85336 RepID=UPI002DD64E47|nr:iron ABC transporter permease [Rothia nasimurium]